METLVIGTSNPAKKNMVRSALKSVNIRLMGIDDLNISLEIEEDGKTAQENARKKAIAYAKIINHPVLSIDNALYLEGLSDAEQPGINTRTVPGVIGRATDEQLLQFYSAQVKRLGGETDGRWEFAVCIAQESGRLFETTIVSPRKFTSQASLKMISGYPLESIQIDPQTGKYISEMNQEEQDIFWQRVIGTPLSEFVVKSLREMTSH